MRHLVVDCETTGLSHEKNKVLTVGMLHANIDVDDLEIVDREHIKVKHDEYNPSGIALKINRINLAEHHECSIYPKFACEQIDDFIKSNCLMQAPVLGHNIQFDFRFLRALHLQGGRNFGIEGESVDTMRIWRALRARGHVPLEMKSSLKVLSKYFGVSYAGAHDALEDCRITAEVYQELLRLIWDRKI